MQVTLFNRGLTPDDFGLRVSRITGNRKDFRKFYNIFHGKRYDVVIDLIGYDPEEVKLAEKTFRNFIGQYIFISTGQVYLVTENKRLPCREDDFYQELIPCPPGEEDAYEYGINKRKIEIFLEERYKMNGFPSVRFRCPVIHGTGDYTLRFYSYLLRIRDGNPLIILQDGDTIIRHIYVQDVVRTIMAVLHADQYRGKVYNLAQKEVLRLSGFLELTAGILGKKIKIVKLTQDEFLKYRLPGEISPFSGRWVSYLDPALAMNETGFETTPPEKWIPVVADYFLKEYTGPVPENYRNRLHEIDVIDKLQLG